jgi:hypothetical protein
MKVCLFCGATGLGVLSNEHVVPQWLLEYLALPGHDQMFHGVSDSKTGEVTAKRVFSSFAFVEGRVCEEKCNNGWMNRLEVAAKPILIPLMDGTRSLPDLTARERTLVAKWAAKTAYMHSSAGLLGKPVQPAHMESLNTDLGTLAPRVHVFAGQADHLHPSSYLQAGTWPQASILDVGPETPPDAYKIALQFKRLYLLTAWWPDAEAQIVAAPLHYPVWPLRYQTGIIWKGFIPSNAAVHPLYRFATELAVFHPTRIVIPNFAPRPI